jgi:outer membrane immunogenic protein
MQKIWRLAAAALLSLATVPAIAADAPPSVSREIFYAPAAAPLVPSYSWTACYVGGNLGGIWASKTFTDVAGIGTGIPGTSLGSHTAAGGMGGGQVGCDYQLGWAVIGLQGMFDLASGNNNNTWPSMSSAALIPGGATGFLVNTTAMHWYSALTARAGFVAMPRVLVYAKGGAAWLGEDHSVQSPGGSAILLTATPSRSGWTAGVGVEWGFTANWSVFAEYNYADFGTSSLQFAPLSSFGPALPINIQQKVNMVVFGLNVRFGPGPWPVSYY